MKQAVNYKYLDNNEVSSLDSDVAISYGTANDKAIASVDIAAQEVELDTTGLPVEVEISNIQALPNEAYALLRRNGFGGSDASVLLGVNPYKTLPELIKEKSSMILSEEEKEIGTKVAVRKGNDLEPLVIEKYTKIMGAKTIKPVDMYKFKEYPYLKMNFDGVNIENEKPFPAEIKVATYYGQKNYNTNVAFFSENFGFRPLPEDVSTRNWSTEQKASHYGIPVYYYTQLQQEMLALDAPYGHIAVIFDKDWHVHIWHVWRDIAVQNEIILKGYKAWNNVLVNRANNGWTDKTIDDIVKLTKVDSPTAAETSFEEKLQEDDKFNQLEDDPKTT